MYPSAARGSTRSQRTEASEVSVDRSGLRVRPDDVRAEFNGISLRPDSFVRPGSSFRERLPLRSMKEVNQSFPAMLFLDQDAGNGQLKCTAS
ncbi:unnamed protein product [Boreogadus saida]